MQRTLGGCRKKCVAPSPRSKQIDPPGSLRYNGTAPNNVQELAMLPKGSPPGGQPGNYLVVASVVIGVAAGIVLASLTGQSFCMAAGLVAGALVAFWLARRPDP